MPIAEILTSYALWAPLTVIAALVFVIALTGVGAVAAYLVALPYLRWRATEREKDGFRRRSWHP